MIFRRDDDDDPIAATAPEADHPEHSRRTRTREQARELREQAREQGGDMAENNGEVTIVGAGARLEGNVVSAGNLRIDGQVKGQINADGDVTLSPQSQVEADIRAQNVSVAGKFKGNLVVKGKAHLARGGRIDGNITSKTLVVEEGGMFHGQSIMDGGSGAAPAKQGQAPQAEAKGGEQVKVP
jgi:cytoskeletal protein CcmA (bactofilin family)